MRVHKITEVLVQMPVPDFPVQYFWWWNLWTVRRPFYTMHIKNLCCVIVLLAHTYFSTLYLKMCNWSRVRERINSSSSPHRCLATTSPFVVFPTPTNCDLNCGSCCTYRLSLLGCQLFFGGEVSTEGKCAVWIRRWRTHSTWTRLGCVYSFPYPSRPLKTITYVLGVLVSPEYLPIQISGLLLPSVPHVFQNALRSVNL